MYKSKLKELKKFAKENGLTIITIDKTLKLNRLGYKFYIFDNKTDKRIYKHQCDKLTENEILFIYMFICGYFDGLLKINV